MTYNLVYRQDASIHMNHLVKENTYETSLFHTYMCAAGKLCIIYYQLLQFKICALNHLASWSQKKSKTTTIRIKILLFYFLKYFTSHRKTQRDLEYEIICHMQCELINSVGWKNQKSHEIILGISFLQFFFFKFVHIHIIIYST